MTTGKGRSGIRPAFTLIELLVVIAIIAILAAILFPVFAQARQSARGAASISNLKQITLGVLMYEQDYDSSYPMMQSWGIGGAACWGACSATTEWTQWTFLIAPYLKNGQVFADPLYGPSGQSAFELSAYPDYGYNYTTLSPSFANTFPWQFPGSAEAVINQPATTVMFTGKYDIFGEGGNGVWGANGFFYNTGNAEAPDCSDIPTFCWTDWAPDGPDGPSMVNLPSLESGLYTGGDSVRKQGSMNYSFVDGHAKFVQPGFGAQGTNWRQGSLSGTIHITNANNYMWQVIQ